MLETRAEIDDIPKVFAVQVQEDAISKGFRSSTPRLQVSCSEGTLSFIYDTDDYLLTEFRQDGIEVTFRIDSDDAVTQRWSKTTGNKAAGLFGQRAVPFLKKVYGAEKIFLRIMERDGELHDGSFDLAGIQSVIDAVANACGVSFLDLSADDYRAIQEMLNAAGFDAGTPDGVWGAGSKSALRSYQESRGLQATGAPDVETLRDMGLTF